MKAEVSICGQTVPADVSKVGLVAIHAPLAGGKGWCLTHLPSGSVLLRTRLKGEATAARKALEGAEDLRTALEALRGS